jgi:hypothetical protein
MRLLDKTLYTVYYYIKGLKLLQLQLISVFRKYRGLGGGVINTLT